MGFRDLTTPIFTCAGSGAPQGPARPVTSAPPTDSKDTEEDGPEAEWKPKAAGAAQHGHATLGSTYNQVTPGAFRSLCASVSSLKQSYSVESGWKRLLWTRQDTGTEH